MIEIQIHKYQVCRSSCPNGTYPDYNSGLCKQCDFSCSQCSGPSCNQCKACQFLTYLYQGACLTTCPSAIYLDESSKSCITYPNRYSICISSTVCSKCQAGFQQSGQICTKTTQCTSRCASCSFDLTYCISCLSGLFLSPLNTCISSCPAYYFQNNTNMTCTSCSDANTCSKCDNPKGFALQCGQCTVCASTCTTCSLQNSDSYLSCKNNMYLSNKQCVATCPSRFYNAPDYTCSQRFTGYIKCSDGKSCITCDSNYKLFTQNSVQICITSSSCFYPCSTCSGTFQPTTCTSCSQGFYLQGTSCVNSCDQGYYLDKQIKHAQNALQVAQNYLQQNNCVATCPGGTFADQTSNKRLNCPNKCSAYSSTMIYNKCQVGFQLSGQIFNNISQCTSPCAQCSSDTTHCISCINGFFLYPQNTCVASCPVNYFQNNTSMTYTPCSNGCSKYSDANTCSQCDNSKGFRLQGSSCTLCISPCATYSSVNPNSCLYCENNMYLSNSQWVTTCPNGFYNGPNYICSPCTTRYNQCQNGNSCTSCSSGYQLFTQNNVQTCITSSTCFSPCSTCSGTFKPTTCTSCNKSFYLQGSSCVAQYSTGYYVNQSSQTCIQCPANFNACSGPSTCTACANNYVLSQNSCVITCPQGFSNKNQICTQVNVSTTSQMQEFTILFF
ncbi:hypothetical protein ABPG72_000531 [Tetrahymena utriculariae]